MTKAFNNKSEKPFYVNFREIGLKLKEMESSIINTTHQKVKSQWFHSDSDVDIVLWRDERKNIIKQQVNLFGQVIEWNIVEGLKTGFVIETEDSQEVDTEASLQKESKLKPNVICYDSSPSQHSIHQAVDVVRFAGPLHQFDKDVVISNFLEAPKIASMDPKVFFETFGTKSNFGTKLTFFIKILRRFFK